MPLEFADPDAPSVGLHILSLIRWQTGAPHNPKRYRPGSTALASPARSVRRRWFPSARRRSRWRAMAPGTTGARAVPSGHGGPRPAAGRLSPRNRPP